MTHFVTVSRFDPYEILSITGVYHTHEEAERAIKKRNIGDGVMFEEIIEVDDERGNE